MQQYLGPGSKAMKFGTVILQLIFKEKLPKAYSKRNANIF
jgi:hypothetical protein